MDSFLMTLWFSYHWTCLGFVNTSLSTPRPSAKAYAGGSGETVPPERQRFETGVSQQENPADVQTT